MNNTATLMSSTTKSKVERMRMGAREMLSNDDLAQIATEGIEVRREPQRRIGKRRAPSETCPYYTLGTH